MTETLLPTGDTTGHTTGRTPGPTTGHRDTGRPDIRFPGSELRATVRGDVLLPGDPGFDAAAMPWNVAVAQRPAAVVVPADAPDVAALVQWARRAGATLSTQPTGHGASGVADGTVLVRTGALDEVWIDADARVARVGAGVRWDALLEALDGTGLLAPAGSNPSVSVTGYLLGGGLSWFGRRHGVAARHVRAVELVDGHGRLRWVTDESEPDLMWALRGGGGEYGIVTRLEIDLQREPEIHGGKLLFPADAAAAVFGAFAAVTATAPDGLTAWASIMHFPDVPGIPDPLRGASVIDVSVTHLGTAGELDALLAGLRVAAPVLHDTVGPVPVGQVGAVAQEPTDPTPAMEWAGTLDRFDADVIATLVGTAGDRAATALFKVQVRHLGGALAEPGEAAGPAAVDRVTAPYAVHAIGIPAVPELVGPIEASFAGLAEALAPYGAGLLPPTFLPPASPADQVYPPETLARLRAVKVAADPDGVIRGNRPLT